MSLRRLITPSTLRGAVLSAALLAATFGCSAPTQNASQLSTGADTPASSPYHGGIQEVGLVSKVKLSTPDMQLKDKDGFKVDCLVTLTPKLNFRAPTGEDGDDGDIGESVKAAEPKPLGATGAEWCLGLKKGASYLVFWDPEANIHFTQFGQRPGGGKELVASNKRVAGFFCRVTFIGPDPSDKPYTAGPFPKDYCDAVKAK